MLAWIVGAGGPHVTAGRPTGTAPAGLGPAADKDAGRVGRSAVPAVRGSTDEARLRASDCARPAAARALTGPTTRCADALRLCRWIGAAARPVARTGARAVARAMAAGLPGGCGRQHPRRRARRRSAGGSTVGPSPRALWPRQRSRVGLGLRPQRQQRARRSHVTSQTLSPGPETPKPARSGLRKCWSALRNFGCGGRI